MPYTCFIAGAWPWRRGPEASNFDFDEKGVAAGGGGRGSQRGERLGRSTGQGLELIGSQPASQSVTTTGLRGVDTRQELRGTCGRVARRRCGRRQRQGKRGLGFPIPSAMYFSGFCKVHTILEFTMYVQYTPSCEQNLQPPEIYKWCLPCGPRPAGFHRGIKAPT